MIIYLKPIGILKKFFNDSDNKEYIEINIDNKSRIVDLLNNLGITENKVALVAINGKTQKLDTLLQSGDMVKLYPFITGG
jgi:sulfur carrier protein ThiS